MNYSVTRFIWAESKTSENLPQLLWDAFTADKPPSNGSLGSLGSVVQTVCHGTERRYNYFNFLFMVLITVKFFKKRGEKVGVDHVPFLRPECLWDSVGKREWIKTVANLEMCVRRRLTLTGCRGEELALAQHTDRHEKPSLPILMRHCEGLSAGLQPGPLGVRCSRIADGGTRRKPVAAGWGGA